MMTGGHGLTIKGELTADEDLALDGHFEGSIDLAGHCLAASAGSHVNASVAAKGVTILGRLEGHITADRVEIGPAARVDASVVTEHLVLQDGAQFTGAVNTDRARAAGDVARHRLKTPEAI
jgi:cytoskeletal protein CcmA (bactofilin family)